LELLNHLNYSGLPLWRRVVSLFSIALDDETCKS